MANGRFALDDFLEHMKMIRKMGSLKDLMKMIPSLGKLLNSKPGFDPEADMSHIEAIIRSMTPYERRHPEKIDRSRRHRIAHGAGTGSTEVERLLIDFEGMKTMASNMPKKVWKNRLNEFFED